MARSRCCRRAHLQKWGIRVPLGPESRRVCQTGLRKHYPKVQHELRRFELRVVCSRETEWEQARGRLMELSRSLLGSDLDLLVERVERLTPEPGGKVKGVISRCRS